MILKPQDVLIALRLFDVEKDWSFQSLANSLFMSVSETHAGVKRGLRCGILRTPFGAKKPEPDSRRLRPFLIHGLPIILPLELGRPAKGIPTSYAAAPLKDKLESYGNELVPVWADDSGSVAGVSVLPLFPSVTKIIRQDTALFEWLVVVDGLRAHQARVRGAAQHELEQKLDFANLQAA